MKTWHGVMFNNDNYRTSETSCILCVHAFGGILLSHHEGMDAYIQWQDNDRYALHSPAVTVLVLTSPGIRGSQSMPTGVRTSWWAHTRTYGLRVEYMVHVHVYLLGLHRRENETKRNDRWYEPRDIIHTIYFNEDVKKMLSKLSKEVAIHVTLKRNEVWWL